MTDHKACAEAFAADAQRIVKLLADELIHLAEGLKRRAEGFQKGQKPPTELAASIVREYTSLGVPAAARLWTIVYSAGKSEWHRARLEVEVSNE